MRIAVADCRVDGRRGPAVIDTAARVVDRDDPGADTVLSGTLIPGLCDAHVHLGLVSRAELERGVLARVTDFGWSLADASAWAADRASPVHVDVAGNFLAAPGGYPSQASWAERGATLFVAAPSDAPAAVARMARAGARVIKVTLNSDAGPVFDDPTLRAIVAAAHEGGLPVAVHVEGGGQAARAAFAGADVLAHTPWTEHLDDALLDHMVVAGMRWISTLDIHGWGRGGAEYDTALANLRRFAARGGRVVYGTDLGNGALPVGLNPRELAALADAGLTADAVVATLDGFIAAPDAAWTYVPEPVPASGAEIARWLARAVRITPGALGELSG